MRKNNKLSIRLVISPGTPVSSSLSIPARLLSSARSPPVKRHQKQVVARRTYGK